MGLTKEVREFFTSRIYRVINSKISKLASKIDEEGLKDLAVERCEKEFGLKGVVAEGLALKKELEAISEEREKEREKIEALREAKDAKYSEKKSKLDEKMKVYSNKIETALKKNDKYYYHCSYRSIDEGDFISLAQAKFVPVIKAEKYPEILKEIEKLDKIKDDVQGAVLLATTETKLVEKLSAVLSNYGGDIEEIRKVLPM